MSYDEQSEEKVKSLFGSGEFILSLVVYAIPALLVGIFAFFLSQFFYWDILWFIMFITFGWSITAVGVWFSIFGVFGMYLRDNPESIYYSLAYRLKFDYKTNKKILHTIEVLLYIIASLIIYMGGKYVNKYDDLCKVIYLEETDYGYIRHWESEAKKHSEGKIKKVKWGNIDKYEYKLCPRCYDKDDLYEYDHDDYLEQQYIHPY